MEKPEYVIRLTKEELEMFKPIMAACDDCGVETDRGDLYDSPWADNKVRCMDCFLKFCGYDPEAVNEWAARMADIVRQQLAEIAHAHATQQWHEADPLSGARTGSSGELSGIGNNPDIH